MRERPDLTSDNLRPLSATDYAIASDDPDVRGWAVVDAAGTPLGHVGELIIDTQTMKVHYLQLRDSDGRDDIYAPVQDADLDTTRRTVTLRSSGTALRGGSDDTGLEQRAQRAAPSQGTTEERLTRAEEEVRIGKRATQAGEIRVGKHVETEHRHEDVTVTREQVHVERRPVTDAHAPAEIRASAEEIRVPIIEEEVVVEKRPVVKEELIISKERVQETTPVDVEVKREEFDIHEDRTGPADGPEDMRRKQDGR